MPPFYQGFLRRVHRWPLLLPEHPVQAQYPASPIGSNRKTRQTNDMGVTLHPASTETDPVLFNLNPFQTPPTAHPESTRELVTKVSRPPLITRKPSVAEIVLGELQSKDLRHSGAVTIRGPRDPTQDNSASEKSDSRRHSLVSTISHSASIISTHGTQVRPRSSITVPQNTPRTRRLSKSPSQRNVTQGQSLLPAPVYPPEIVALLDGEHHTDELASRFEAGWSLLEKWLVAVGEGKGDGDFGKVCIIYR